LYNIELGLSPIHVAARSGDAVALAALFYGPSDNRPDINARSKNGRTALHFAVEAGSDACLEFLLRQPSVQVDVADKKGGQTPLFLAAKKGAGKACRALIASGADFDQKVLGKTAAEIMRERGLGLDPQSVPRQRPPMARGESVDAFAAAADNIHATAAAAGRVHEGVDTFKTLVNTLGPALNTRDSGGYTLLQLAAAAGLGDHVAALLDADADPNVCATQTPVPPLLLAAEVGSPAVITLLLERGANVATAVATEAKENVLHVLLKQGAGKDPSRWRQCLTILLTPHAPWRPAVVEIINKRDVLGNTPLHYATQMWPQTIVRQLLELGANIGMKNHWEDVPITKIDPQTMEEFLDEFCLIADGDVNHETFEVTYNYSFLAPPIEDLPLESREGLNSIDPEHQKLRTAEEEPKVALPETQSLWYMGQSKDHRHLLTHPVITRFLYLKWGRIRKDFNRNLRFYLLFVFMLTWFIFEKFGGENILLSGSEGKTALFWHSAYYLLFIIMFAFIIRDGFLDIKERWKTQSMKKPDDNDHSSSSKLFFRVLLGNWIEVFFLCFMIFIMAGCDHLSVVKVSLIILTCLLILRELFQMTVSLKRYILSPENWLEMSVILLVLFIIFHPDYSVKEEESENLPWDLKRHMASIAIVISWAELITLVGKHPNLTRYNVYVVMFYKVMATFFFFLIWYAFFIIAFGLAFYILLHGNPGTADYRFFNSTWLSLIKTSTMFVGELEFGDLPINEGSTLEPLSYIFFLSFVFLIVVVLMNLLNGLAVSDTGLIQQKAEIISYISRVDTISYTESVLLGDPFNFLSNWPAFKRLRDVPSFSLCTWLYKSGSMRRLFHKLSGATDILLFYNILPTKKLTLKPNKRNFDCNFCRVINTD